MPVQTAQTTVVQEMLRQRRALSEKTNRPKTTGTSQAKQTEAKA